MVGGKQHISTRQIQHMLNCSMKTAWFLTHRVREFISPKSLERGRHAIPPRCDLRARGASFAPLNRRAASYRTKQARRFKELAKDVGADDLPEGFADAVHKLAAAGPVRRKPLNARPQTRTHWSGVDWLL